MKKSRGTSILLRSCMRQLILLMGGIVIKEDVNNDVNLYRKSRGKH